MVRARYLLDVLVSELAVYAIHKRPHLPRIDEQRLAATVTKLRALGVGRTSVALVPRDEPQAHRYLRRVEELTRQCDHTIDQVRLDDRLPYLSLARLARRHAAIREYESGHPGRRQVVDEVLHPREVCVARRRHAVLPTLIVAQKLATPVAVVEVRVRQYVVSLQVRVLIVVEAVAVCDLAGDPADRQVHVAQPPRRVVRLLPVDRDRIRVSVVLLDELLALDEHAARSAAGVKDAPAVRSEHLHEETHYVRRRVELSALLPLRARELREKVLIHAPEYVLRATLGIAQADPRY